MPHSPKSNSATPVTVVYPGHMVSSVPALQHTAVTSAVIVNQFEPLFRRNLGGTLTPLAGLSWEAIDNHTLFRIKIDTTRRFSDGASLKASHFKEAWEYGLGLNPLSANSSLSDVMSHVVGFENFQSSRHLEGLVVRDPDVLEIRFKKPFRMALDEISGARYGVFRKTGETYVGTGPYTIEMLKPGEAKLRKNPFFTATPIPIEEVRVITLPPKEAVSAFLEKRADILAMAERADPLLCGKAKDYRFDCRTGEDSAHRHLTLNAVAGRFFQNPQHRRALQSLVWRSFRSNTTYEAGLGGRLDPQFLLPFQPGRLDESEVQRLMASNESEIQELVEASQKQPIRILTPFESDPAVELLKQNGIVIENPNHVVTTAILLDSFYKKQDADIYSMTTSTWNGDPDGIYHFLGKQGAIASPASSRPIVERALEAGKEILNPADLDPAYRKVSEAILREVPSIHLGFLSSTVLYWPDRVKHLEPTVTRHSNGLTNFEER